MTVLPDQKSPQSDFLSELKNRLHLENLLQSTLITKTDEGQEIIQGLSNPQKSIPSRYFYDDRGSILFEQICDLPEYYPTRTEASILQQYALEIAESIGSCELVELGSGSSTKTRILFDAYHQLGCPLRYVPVDVSGAILENSAQQLLTDYPNLEVSGLVSTYDLALKQLKTRCSMPRTIAFLGSTLGNFSPEQCDHFLSQVTSALTAGDYFLLGIDLQKPINIIEAAYNDSQGVTAAFNLNSLNHLNWRFEGNFSLNLFEHRAIYNHHLNRIEMYLVCLRSHQVRLEKLDLTVELTAGEAILTEISCKFNLTEIKHKLAQQGLKFVKAWTDDQQWFGLCLGQMQ